MRASRFNPVLFKYADDVPIERLHRHFRIAWWIVHVWLFSSVLMCSSLAEFMFGPESLRSATRWILTLAALASVLSMLPGIICFKWGEEIEKTLQACGYPLPLRHESGLRIGMAAMKMCFWFAVVILGVHLFS